MPHKCMECQNLIESGQIDLQKGCPICGGKKFQYVRIKKEGLSSPTVAEYVARAALEEPQRDSRPVDLAREKPEQKLAAAQPAAARPTAPQPAAEPMAQHVAQPSNPAAKAKPSRAKQDTAPAGERIESIHIVEQGTYDINLPMLLSRKELVMSREEGTYVVDLNSALKPKKLWGKKKKK